MTRQQISKIVLSRLAQLDARLNRGEMSDAEWFQAAAALSAMAMLWLKNATGGGTISDSVP